MSIVNVGLHDIKMEEKQLHPPGATTTAWFPICSCLVSPRNALYQRLRFLDGSNTLWSKGLGPSPSHPQQLWPSLRLGKDQLPNTGQTPSVWQGRSPSLSLSFNSYLYFTWIYLSEVGSCYESTRPGTHCTAQAVTEYLVASRLSFSGIDRAFTIATGWMRTFMYLLTTHN